MATGFMARSLTTGIAMSLGEVNRQHQHLHETMAKRQDEATTTLDGSVIIYITDSPTSTGVPGGYTTLPDDSSTKADNIAGITAVTVDGDVYTPYILATPTTAIYDHSTYTGSLSLEVGTTWYLLDPYLTMASISPDTTIAAPALSPATTSHKKAPATVAQTPTKTIICDASSTAVSCGFRSSSHSVHIAVGILFAILAAAIVTTLAWFCLKHHRRRFLAHKSSHEDTVFDMTTPQQRRATLDTNARADTVGGNAVARKESVYFNRPVSYNHLLQSAEMPAEAHPGVALRMAPSMERKVSSQIVNSELGFQHVGAVARSASQGAK